LPRLRLIDGNARTAMVASDAILLASGTATLEAMLAQRPMVVGYRIAPLTHALVKGLGMLKVDSYSLPNVLAGERVVPELMQDDCTPDALARAVLRWFRDPAAIGQIQPRFRAIHAELRRDASAQAARAVAELLGDGRPPSVG
jgi:lipid-A-disaccharide synthase